MATDPVSAWFPSPAYGPSGSRGSQLGRSEPPDQTALANALAWPYQIDDFFSGISVTSIETRLKRDGLPVRCYGNLQRDEKVEPTD